MAESRDSLAGHPDLAGAGASMREEWRAEEEAAGADAVERWRHGLSLRDRLVECMHRGDPVAALVSGHRFAGEVVEVSDDLVSLRSVAGRVDVHICDAVPVAFEVVERVRAGGHLGEVSTGGFRARLLARETEGSEATVGSAFAAEPFDGRIHVGADHVSIVGRGGGEVFLPLSAVAFVAPRRP